MPIIRFLRSCEVDTRQMETRATLYRVASNHVFAVRARFTHFTGSIREFTRWVASFAVPFLQTVVFFQAYAFIVEAQLTFDTAASYRVVPGIELLTLGTDWYCRLGAWFGPFRQVSGRISVIFYGSIASFKCTLRHSGRCSIVMCIYSCKLELVVDATRRLSATTKLVPTRLALSAMQCTRKDCLFCSFVKT